MVLAVLCVVPTVQAAPFYIELTATIESAVPIQDLVLRTGTSGNPAGPCSTSYFSGNAAQARFTFEEGSEGNGCLSVVYPFVVPEGVQRMSVHFLADRALDDSVQNVNLGPNAFEQELRLRVGTTVVAGSPYFDPQQPEQASQAFTIGFDIPAATREVEVEWWFANRDDAPDGGDPSARLQAWSARVSQPSLLLEGIRLPTPVLQQNRGQIQGASYLTGYSAEVAVPTEYRAAAAAGRVSLHLRMPDSALVDRVLAPGGGNLPDEDHDVSIVGASRLVTIPGDTLARLGPGPYVLRFQGSEPLHVEPSMAALAGLVFLMPPVALVFAARQLRRRSLATYLEAADALEGELEPR